MGKNIRKKSVLLIMEIITKCGYRKLFVRLCYVNIFYKLLVD